MAAVGMVALLGLAACGSGTGQDSTSAGSPHRGGTLTLVGTSDVDHMDTVDAYYTVTNIVLRAFTRQLVTYKATNNAAERSVVVPDLATEVPTQANGGVTDGGKTYTFHLRPDVMWNTSPPRPVTAQDVVLGMKRLCNPVHPVPAPGYYENTIVGFQQYCEAFLKAPGTVSGISDFIKSHDISGTQATDATTVVFHLNSPASDFVNIMTLPFASPAPVEYLKYIPDSPQLRTHTISDGPYQITRYQANKEIDLGRNPAWKASTDPLRKAYVNKVTVTEGIDSTAVQQQLEAGAADMEWDTNVPPASLPGLFGSKDPRLVITGAGSTNPYLVFNFLSPNANQATSKLKVRQALEYAVNKKAIIQVQGGPRMGGPLDTFLTPEVKGYQQFDMYPSKDHKGDPAKAKKLLAEAGYPNGLTLKLLYSTSDTSPKIAQTLQADLAKANITLKLVPATQSDFYANFLQTPSVAKRGVWDIATPGWTPDWPGNAARSFIVPILDGRTFAAGSTNYGDFNDPQVNQAIDKALSTPDANQAAKFWHQADVRAMQQAAIVPIREAKLPIFHAANVHNFQVLPLTVQGDITNVWLSN
ncbi:MAG TPA: ABC transporter substrate-binding protein [Mycobacteriales bacterium]|nr:ABC transporter substrate-binding protein [Mycobacteriales bacterium]